jgi:hypothetical protein
MLAFMNVYVERERAKSILHHHYIPILYERPLQHPMPRSNASVSTGWTRGGAVIGEGTRVSGGRILLHGTEQIWLLCYIDAVAFSTMICNAIHVVSNAAHPHAHPLSAAIATHHSLAFVSARRSLPWLWLSKKGKCPPARPTAEARTSPCSIRFSANSHRLRKVARGDTLPSAAAAASDRHVHVQAHRYPATLPPHPQGRRGVPQ